MTPGPITWRASAKRRSSCSASAWRKSCISPAGSMVLGVALMRALRGEGVVWQRVAARPNGLGRGIVGAAEPSSRASFRFFLSARLLACRSSKARSLNRPLGRSSQCKPWCTSPRAGSHSEMNAVKHWGLLGMVASVRPRESRSTLFMPLFPALKSEPWRTRTYTSTLRADNRKNCGWLERNTC